MNNRLLTGIAVVLMSLPAWAAGTGNDPDLLTHYTFDKDEGRRVTDLSSYGNSAENMNGQWVADVQGHRGVMRFNGTNAMLTAQSPSLALEGDCTISMWIRRNADELNPRCTIFEDPSDGVDWGFQDYIHFIIYSYWQDPQVGNERQSFPMDHDMFATNWNHIAVVFEYPRMRAYRNGKLYQEFWMVHPAEMKSNKKMIGGNGRFFGYFDLDDFRLYKRALSATEVQAVFNEQPLPVAKESEIQLEPYWYENKLIARLNSRNLYPPDGSMSARLTTKDGKTRTQTASLSASGSTGTTRTVGELSFELADIVSQPGKMEIDVYDQKKSKVATLTKEMLIEKPAWVYNEIGIPKGVPAPWTPVKVVKTVTGLTFDVWGRRYTVGQTPFFA
jgi:hypothetical protein